MIPFLAALRGLFAAALLAVALPAAAAIEIVEVTTPGGIEAWLVEEPSIPFVALEIRFRGGASLDPADRRGAANLMTALLEEGAGDMDARAFQTAREELAAGLGFEVGDDSLSVSARFLTENREAAVALLRQALMEPRFDADAIERVRAQILSGLASDAVNPNRMASEAFYAAAFGDHPYASDLSGTPQSVAAITQADLVAAHRNLLTRDRLYVAAVGDISPEELGVLLDDLLGGLPAAGPPLPSRVGFGLGGGVTVVPFETPQSVALFGHAGIARDDDDFFAAYILNHILGGGGFSSRLMQDLREARGLTYGIGTYLVPKDHAALMLGSLASSNATMAEAIALIEAEWQSLATQGISQEELDRAVVYLTGEYPLRFDGNAKIAEIMVAMQMIDLPPDYVINRNAYIEAVTLDEINRVASELLDPAGLHFVVVGQPSGLNGDDVATTPAELEGAGSMPMPMPVPAPGPVADPMAVPAE